MKRTTARCLSLLSVLAPALAWAHPGHDVAGPIAGFWHFVWSLGPVFGLPLLGLAAFFAAVSALGRSLARASRAEAAESHDA